MVKFPGKHGILCTLSCFLSLYSRVGIFQNRTQEYRFGRGREREGCPDALDPSPLESATDFLFMIITIKELSFLP